MAGSGYTYVWEYRVAAARLQDFLRVYGRDGDWVRLFRGVPGYLRSELYCDRADPLHFITIDHWTSAQAFAAFRASAGEAYKRLDARCAKFTEMEREIGRFVPVE